MGYGRLREMVQGKDTLNNNQSLIFRRWWHGPLFFLHQFMRLVLLLLLYHSGKIAIPHYHLFLLLHILHLILFKLLQRQGDLSISGDSHVVFCWDRDENRRISFLKRADLPFVRNGFFAIYFWPSVSKSYPPCAVTMGWGLRRYWWQVNIFRYIGLCCWPRRWCAM